MPVGRPAVDGLLRAILLGIVGAVALLPGIAGASTTAASTAIHGYDALAGSREDAPRAEVVTGCSVGLSPPGWTTADEGLQAWTRTVTPGRGRRIATNSGGARFVAGGDG